MTNVAAPERRVRQRGWLVPAALVALSAIPVAAGTLRLTQLAGAGGLTPDTRFGKFPAPVVVHVVSVAVYALLGAFQFARGFRRRHRTWHRRTGRVLVGAGLLVAASALVMTLAYAQKRGTGNLLYVTRLTVASAMAAFLILGISAARHREFAAHRRWMMRAYALGLGAGTQIFTVPIVGAAFGSGVVRRDVAMTAAWVLNLVVAEWLIRRQRGRPPASSAAVPRPRAVTLPDAAAVRAPS